MRFAVWGMGKKINLLGSPPWRGGGWVKREYKSVILRGKKRYKEIGK
jgi:hypothetical protein